MPEDEVSPSSDKTALKMWAIFFEISDWQSRSFADVTAREDTLEQRLSTCGLSCKRKKPVYNKSIPDNLYEHDFNVKKLQIESNFQIWLW